MSSSKMGIGQHRSDGTPAINSGQRTRRDPAANVGPNLSGGEMQNTVPAGRPDGDISSTTGSAGPMSRGSGGAFIPQSPIRRPA